MVLWFATLENNKTNLVLVILITIGVGLTIVWVLDFISELRWEKTRLLTWDDFRGIPDLGAIALKHHGAVIKSDIKYQISYETKIVQGSCHYWFTKVEGIAYMSRIESWANPMITSSYRSLQHEQTHFDIAEVHARIFNERVKNELLNQEFLCPVGSNSWFQSKIKMEANALATAILDQIKDQLRFVQNAYDVQTEHGRDYEKQREWEYRIRDIIEN